MTKFGWAMFALIIAIVLAVVFFVWTGIVEHPAARETNQPEAWKRTTEEPPATSEFDGAAHDIAIPAGAEAARSALAANLSLSAGDILIRSALPTDWPDACLGLPKEGELCAQAITPGFAVTLSFGGREYRYRTNADGTVLRAEEK